MNRASLLQSKLVQSSQCHLGGQPGAAQWPWGSGTHRQSLLSAHGQSCWSGTCSQRHPALASSTRDCMTAWAESITPQKCTTQRAALKSGALAHAEMNTNLYFAYYCQMKSFIRKTVDHLCFETTYCQHCTKTTPVALKPSAAFWGGFKQDRINFGNRGSIGQNLSNTSLFSLSFLAKLSMEAFSHFMNAIQTFNKWRHCPVSCLFLFTILSVPRKLTFLYQLSVWVATNALNAT